MQDKIELWVKFLPMLGGVLVFAWGVFQHFDTQAIQVKANKIEARKPFLERQLKLYTEATQVASKIANAKEPNESAQAADRFWALYWGELVLVEDRRVESAMVRFGEKLKGKRVVRVVGGEEQELNLKDLSLELARACRESLAESWGVQEWRDPHLKPSA